MKTKREKPKLAPEQGTVPDTHPYMLPGYPRETPPPCRGCDLCKSVTP